MPQSNTVHGVTQTWYGTLADYQAANAQKVPVRAGTVVMDASTTPYTFLGISDGAGGFTGGLSPAQYSALTALLAPPTLVSTTFSGDVSGAITIDVSKYEIFNLRATGNITGITIVGKSPANGYAVSVNISAISNSLYTVAWPGYIQWSSGAAPAQSASQSQPLRVQLTSTPYSGAWIGTNYTTTSQNTVVSDTFAGSANTELNGHTPTSGTSNAWSATAGNWVINGSNQVTPAATWVDGQIASLDIGLNNYSISFQVTSTFTNAGNRASCGVIVNYNDNNNFILSEYDLGDQVITIYEVSSGNYNLKASIALSSVASGTQATLKWDVYGANCTFSYNGVEKCSFVTQAATPTSKIGFRSGKTGTPPSRPLWGAVSVTPYNNTPINWPVFVKSQQTPVLPHGGSGAWDQTDVANPNALYDPVGLRWILNYTGYKTGSAQVQNFGMSYASSLTASSWNKFTQNPVITADSTDGYYSFNGGIAYCYGQFWALQGTSNGAALRMWTSKDLVNWKDGGVVVTGNLPSAAAWKISGVGDAFLRVTQNGVLEAWYLGAGSYGRSFGRATINAQGIITEDTRNPLLALPSDVFGPTYVGEPSVYVPQGQEGIQYLISFDGNVLLDSGGVCSRVICQAATLDGCTSWKFRASASSPIGGGSWESAQNFDSFMILDGSTMRLFYGGANVSGNALDLNIQVGRSDAVWTSDTLVGP